MAVRSLTAPRAPHSAVAMAVCVALSAMGPTAFGQDFNTQLSTIDTEVESLAHQVSLVRSTLTAYGGGSSIQEQTRLADGRMLFLLEDYVRAAIVFLDIVENSSHRGTINYREARWYLAESLYLARNFAGARSYLAEIQADPRDPFYMDAVQRLLEIAFDSQDYEAIASLHEAMIASGSPSRPDVIYVLAKALYFQGDYSGAVAEFGRIDASADDYIRALYFSGVCYVRLDNWEAALNTFERTTETALGSEQADAQSISDLAYLALGRTYYELEQWQDAIEAYQAVSRAGDHYDHALYELTWAFLQDERYGDALRTLEILTLALPDSQFAPRAQLLRGDLLMRNNEYAEAAEIFDSTIEEFGPLAQQLTQVTDHSRDMSGYLEVVTDSLNAEVVLPDLAREWVESDEDMVRALQLLDDLESQTRELQDSRDIITEIEIVLGSSSRVDLFPELRQAYAQALGLQQDLIQLGGRLMDAESDLLLGHAEPAERDAYREMAARRRTLVNELDQMPSSIEALEALENEVEGEIQALELEVYRLGYEIETQRAQLAAIRLQLHDDIAAGVRPPSEVAQMRSEIVRFESALDLMETERNALRQAFEHQRLQTGLGTISGAAQANLRLEIEYALQNEEASLSRLRTRSDRGADLSDIDRVRLRLAAALAELDRLYSDIDRVVTDQSSVIESQLGIEAALLDTYESTLIQYGAEGEGLAGEIAFQNFLQVQEEFHLLILRADVGIIDIAWREKEERSERIDQLLDQRDRQLDILDAEFREVLEGTDR